MGFQNDFADFCSSLLHFQLIKVHDSNHYKLKISFDLELFPFWILGGHVNNVILKAYDVKSAPDIQSIEPRLRKCLFPQERKLKLYKSYSQSCCLLECKLQFAQSRTHFNCTPWYFPTQDQPIQMCDPWQSQKMEQLMFRDIPPNQCHHCHPGNQS